MTNLKHWFLATRPKTLVACFIPIFCATFLSLKESPLPFHWHLSLFAFLSTLCIQIGTNLVNDAADFQKGADTSERLGPMRVTQMGLIPAKKVLRAGFLFFICAMLFGIPLVMVGGLPIVIIGILAILCGYFYTAGPYPIAYYGLGEVFVFLFFGFTAVSGTYFLHIGHINTQCIILSLQIGALASVILSVNNYRDFMTDKKFGKLTLAARFGKTFARYEILFLFALIYFLNLYWFYNYGLLVFLATTVSLPLAMKVLHGIFSIEPSKEINKYLGLAALTELIYGISISLSFLFL